MTRFARLEKLQNSGMSDTEILNALVFAMSEEEAKENFDYIDRMYETEVEVDEDYQELDVSASEVDDLARDVMLEDTFMTCLETNEKELRALIADVVHSEYPFYDDISKVSDRVYDALMNMLAEED